MPRERISAKYQGEHGEHFMGIPARDLSEGEFAALSDEQQALLAADPPEGVRRLYQLRHEAPEQAEAAAKRLERAPAPPPPMAAAVEAPSVEASSEPKGEGKK